MAHNRGAATKTIPIYTTVLKSCIPFLLLSLYNPSLVSASLAANKILPLIPLCYLTSTRYHSHKFLIHCTIGLRSKKKKYFVCSFQRFAQFSTGTKLIVLKFKKFSKPSFLIFYFPCCCLEPRHSPLYSFRRTGVYSYIPLILLLNVCIYICLNRHFTPYNRQRPGTGNKITL